MIEIVAYIAIGFGLCFALFVAHRHYQVWRFNAELKTQTQINEAANKAAFAALQKYLSENETNTLAKIAEEEQNISNLPEPPQVKANEPPFWRNKERLAATKERLEESGDASHGIPELGTLTPLDAWRAVDQSLVELSESSND